MKGEVYGKTFSYNFHHEREVWVRGSVKSETREEQEKNLSSRESLARWGGLTT